MADNHSTCEKHKAIKPPLPEPCGCVSPCFPCEVYRDRRERIATAVMAGFAAHGDPNATMTDEAQFAVAYADALIVALDEE